MELLFTAAEQHVSLMPRNQVTPFRILFAYLPSSQPSKPHKLMYLTKSCDDTDRFIFPKPGIL